MYEKKIELHNHDDLSLCRDVTFDECGVLLIYSRSERENADGIYFMPNTDCSFQFRSRFRFYFTCCTDSTESRFHMMQEQTSSTLNVSWTVQVVIHWMLNLRSLKKHSVTRICVYCLQFSVSLLAFFFLVQKVKTSYLPPIYGIF